MVSTRRNLLDEARNEELMEKKYSQICNVIVDEAQNFKDWDGDWYTLAEKLSKQPANTCLQHCCNYFWVFMDYSQKVHKFKAGLPSVIGKNNFMLSEVSRNTKEIFQFTSRLMIASENVDDLCNPFLRHVCNVPKLAHSYSTGKGVDILSCEESQIKSLLSKVMSGLLKNGVKENDIAILVGRRSHLKNLQSSLNDAHNDISRTKNQEPKAAEENDSMVESKTGHDKDFNTLNNLKVYGCIETTGKGDNNVMPAPESFEISNPFGALSRSMSLDILQNEEEMNLEDGATAEVSGMFHDTKREIEMADPNTVTKFYGEDSDSDSDSILKRQSSLLQQESSSEVLRLSQEKANVTMDTVRGFSGLDKAAVIGINPEVNEEHADFNRFLLSLASRARDNLVIITTSDNVKEQLNEYASSD